MGKTSGSSKLVSIPVLLLKTPSETASNDPYTSHLTRNPFSPGCNYWTNYVPVLKHISDLDPIKFLLSQLSFSCCETSVQTNFPYGGLIFTSQRAVESFASAVHAAPIGRWDCGEHDHENITISALPELRIPLYAVGPATARALEQLRTEILQGCTIKGGEQTGIGNLLAALILKDYNEGYEDYAQHWTRNQTQETQKKPLLFITGEKHRDVIPSTLQSAPPEQKIDVHEMVVYSTSEDEGFPSRLDTILEDSSSAPTRWCVVFSPQGSAKLLERLDLIDPSTGRVHSAGHECWQNRKTFVASIGPTTRDYLLNTFGFLVDVCAAKPSPHGVTEVMNGFMRNKTDMPSARR